MISFDTKQELAEVLASQIASLLQNAVDETGRALLAVSGGSTPVLLFQTLSKAKISWDSIFVTLVDERCVPPENTRSNAKLVRENLLNEMASQAIFVPLFDPELGMQANLEAISSNLKPILPPTVCVLGMGTDGHTASFFPDAKDLSVATNPQTKQTVALIDAESANERRITLTLPVLLSSKFLALHIEGEPKMHVLNDAWQKGESDVLPIRHILRNRDGLKIYWAP